ncbi:MAG TPA: hypothetical protein VFA71_06670 [Terriglobales bacterium]|nr:hypothetical protein [Terriglobales bacterium]
MYKPQNLTKLPLGLVLPQFVKLSRLAAQREPFGEILSERSESKNLDPRSG